jgi:hypothetical protein
MCWSGEASFGLAAVGIGSTAYATYKGESKELVAPLGYFSLMELLQGFTYQWIDECSLPVNQILTLLGYLHITFQPFFINLISLYFVPKEVKEKLQGWVYTICFICSILLILQMYPYNWGKPCNIGENALCGKQLCSVSGNWHIAWELPTTHIVNLFSVSVKGYMPYIFAAFFLPLLYGSWRITLYHWLVGPTLAELTTNNPNEWPAVWCLFSIGLLLILVKTPLRKILPVKVWYFWKYPKFLSSTPNESIPQ